MLNLQHIRLYRYVVHINGTTINIEYLMFIRDINLDYSNANRT